MNCKCDKVVLKCQPFPDTGPLANQLDLSLADLREKTQKSIQNPVYVYVVTSAKIIDGEYCQVGSAPNFQGGRITLCTCKHKDRASAPKYPGTDKNDPWKGVWIVGITSVKESWPATLFYLMLVASSYRSHRELWRSLPFPKAKSAYRLRHGDVYEPISGDENDEHSATAYYPYLDDHVHGKNERTHDIESVYWERHPRLLEGNPLLSFLWRHPRITLKPDNNWGTAHHRFYQRISCFMETLQ